MSVRIRRGKDHKFLIELFSFASMLTDGPINAPPKMLRTRMTKPEMIQRVYLYGWVYYSKRPDVGFSMLKFSCSYFV